MDLKSVLSEMNFFHPVSESSKRQRRNLADLPGDLRLHAQQIATLTESESLKRQVRKFADLQGALRLQSQEFAESEILRHLAQNDAYLDALLKSETRHAAEHEALENLVQYVAGLSEVRNLQAEDEVLERQARNIAENEVRLKLFYGSGESEMTRNFEFIDCNRPICIDDAGRKGRGIFLKERVVAGQLIIVSTAIVSCPCNCDYLPYENSDTCSSSTITMPPYPRVPPEVQKHLVGNLQKALQEVPMLDCHESPEALIATMEDNSAEFPYSWTGYDNRPSHSDERLTSMVANNAICDKIRGLSESEPRYVGTCELWGVWHLPSFINHSCTPNCHRMIVGDAMIVRAAKDMAAGVEVTLPYFDIFQPLAFRERSCEMFRFRCECRRCTFERSIGKPYDVIQMRISRLQLRLQTNFALGGGALGGASTLNKLARQRLAVDDLIGQLEQESLDRMHQKKQTRLEEQIGELAGDQNVPVVRREFRQRFKRLKRGVQNQMRECEQTTSQEQKVEDVQPDLLSGSTSRSDKVPAELEDSHCESVEEVRALYSKTDGTLAYWLKASFMECYIASCSMTFCETGIFDDHDLVDACRGGLDFWDKSSVSGSGEEKRMQRIMRTAIIPVEIVAFVHPGNPLGQEYYSILLKATRREADLDNCADTEMITRLFLRPLESRAMRLLTAYYGFAGSAVLTQLLMLDA